MCVCVCVCVCVGGGGGGGGGGLRSTVLMSVDMKIELAHLSF